MSSYPDLLLKVADCFKSTSFYLLSYFRSNDIILFGEFILIGL
jgi:hypothetical protein